MVGLTYDTYITQIALMAVVPTTDPNFQSAVPSMISYAELRMYRDLDLLYTSSSVIGYSVSSGTRTITIPSGTLVVSEQINVLTPAGSVNPETSTRVPLLPTTKEFLDNVYGSSSLTGVPKYFVPFNDNLFYVGPFADATYNVEIVGTIRPAPLSPTNTTTFISQYLPDLFVMASLIDVSAYQRNVGRISDDPQMAQTYESQYKELLKGATIEEFRKKFESAAWSSMDPSPIATPSRG